jgi:hypothetical protein
MGDHAVFSPSSAHRWIPCPGSLALSAGLPDFSSSYADEGTAAHILAARTLSYPHRNCDFFLGETTEINGKVWEFTAEMCEAVQVYVTDVRARAKGGRLFIEQKCELDEALGVPGQFGTSDAVILQPGRLTVVDLKYGRGERVDAKENEQGMLYAAGALLIADLLADEEVSELEFVVCQPRLDHIDSWSFTREQLEDFLYRARNSVAEACVVIPLGAKVPISYLNPGEKQCRWCKAKAACPALARKVQNEVHDDFQDIVAANATAPIDAALAIRVVPLIEQWCAAVRAAVMGAIHAGEQIIGPDGQPYKLVEGRKGHRKWRDPNAAAAALLGQLSVDKAYQPAEPITPAAAEKLLGKKAQKAMWDDVFAPLITQGNGKPTLALGSDERPAFTFSADSTEFEVMDSGNSSRD